MHAHEVVLAMLESAPCSILAGSRHLPLETGLRPFAVAASSSAWRQHVDISSPRYASPDVVRKFTVVRVATGPRAAELKAFTQPRVTRPRLQRRGACSSIRGRGIRGETAAAVGIRGA